MNQQMIRIACISLVLINQVYAQKPVLGEKIIAGQSFFNRNWENVKGASISPDGEYVYYTIQSSNNKIHDCIQSIDGSWKKDIPAQVIFSRSGKSFLYQSGDSVYIQSLGKDNPALLTVAASFEVVPGNKKDWLIYKPVNDQEHKLVVRDLVTGKELVQTNVSGYWCQPESSTLVMEKQDADTKEQSLYWCNLQTGQVQRIWKGLKGGDAPVFDKQGTQLAFFAVQDTVAGNKYAVWYYKVGMKAAKQLIGNESAGIDTALVLNPRQRLVFNKSGKRLFFYLGNKFRERAAPVPTSGVKVDVWSYKDIVQPVDRYLPPPIQSQEEEFATGTYLSVCNISTQQVVRLCYEGESAGFEPLNNRENYLLLKKGPDTEAWLKREKPGKFLVSLDDGSRTLLGEAEGNFSFSPQETYILRSRYAQQQYAIYSLIDHTYHEVKNNNIMAGVIGWLKDDKGILVSDPYSDIWQVDPAGSVKPVNLTGSFAKDKQIHFNLVDGQVDISKNLNPSSSLILIAFNNNTKQNGFCRLPLNKPGYPEILSMDDYYYFTGSLSRYGMGVMPVKAGAANSWLVWRESATEAPNYFVTKDFKRFAPITNVQPQKEYNWLTSELVRWKGPDGDSLMGVLYKPENFDASKKYPVIFHYYQEKSDELHVYFEPAASGDEMNIPWFVSRGYLVLVADIHYTMGHPGQSALNSVVAAANYMKQQPWVDGSKMGLQGHSFGGLETNYIITHSNLFAAAVSSAGVADKISSYLGLRGSLAGDNMPYYEAGQGRMEKTPWEDRQRYIDESPVFNADKVTTPVLIVHNKRDPNVSWQQGVEWFNALWRTGKKVWMLQYDNGEHGVFGDDAYDYTMRMTQFFDHYLKEEPAPAWMTLGTATERSTLAMPYELSLNEACGKDCEACKQWEGVQKMDRNGIDTSLAGLLDANNRIWNVIFLHCTDSVILTKALGWQQFIIDHCRDTDAKTILTDTYASLLYKLNRRTEAIAVEEKALQAEKRRAEKDPAFAEVSYYQKQLDKMKAGIPTW